ncbi:MAG: Ig-like domain-containing protein, partial [Clostridiales bacterium]|nr:Ig-like domain-containing protein [Clostridiales bacterium]
MKKGKRLLFATLFMMLVAAMFSFVACGGKKETTTPSAKTGGAYYLSVYEDGQWTTYTAESNVPAARKFAQDATDKNTYKLSIALEEGAKVKIAQVGSTATYGGKELFTARTELTKGTDNALEVSASGTYGFTFDSSDKTISYSFKAKEEGNTGDDRTVLLVEINEAGPFTLTYPATKTLTATVTYDGDAPEEDVITWSSSNKSVATVDEHGVVTAVSAGTTQITAKSGEVDSDPVTINVEGTVTLNETTKTLRIGETLDLEATVAGGATLGDWVSSTPAVASVEEDENDKSKATVTAVAGGETTISLTYLARTGVNKTAICTVKVEQPVTDMTVASSLTVRAGGNQTLTVSFTPEDATNKNYAFAVAEGGDEFITVTKNPDNTLNIAGVKETTAPVVITITSEYDNTIVKTCNVTVVAADANYANINATSLNLNKSDTAELTVDGVGIASVVWTTSSSAVATFVEDTEDDTVVSLITVTAAGFGTATLTATITFDDDEHTTTTRECVVLVMPDQMWVYGDIIEGSSNGWDLTSSYELAQASGTTLAKEGNTYTANIHLTANKDFRIGHDGFDWKGIRWEHISEVAAEKQNVVEGGNDQNGGKNVRVTVAGVYNITVDFSGTKPVLKITIVSVDIVSIVVAAQGNTTLTSSSNTNSVVIKLTINPADAGYEEIVWTSDDNGALVSLQPNEAKDELTVTALDDLTAGGDVTITCTVKSVRGTAYDKTATVALTVVEKGGVSTPVTDVLFDTNGTYTYDVNGQDTWTLSVKAEVNADATNKGVTYKAGETYGDHFQISTSNGIGYITVTRLGTYKIIAEADDNPEKTDEVYVTFYSSQFYVSGGVNGWGTLKPGA